MWLAATDKECESGVILPLCKHMQVLVQTMDTDTTMEVVSLFHTILSLHPPGRSHTAHLQYHQFIQQLGGGNEGDLFSAWLHIKRLLR